MAVHILPRRSCVPTILRPLSRRLGNGNWELGTLDLRLRLYARLISSHIVIFWPLQLPQPAGHISFISVLTPLTLCGRLISITSARRWDTQFIKSVSAARCALIVSHLALDNRWGRAAPRGRGRGSVAWEECGVLHLECDLNGRLIENSLYGSLIDASGPLNGG